MNNDSSGLLSPSSDPAGQATSTPAIDSTTTTIAVTSSSPVARRPAASFPEAAPAETDTTEKKFPFALHRLLEEAEKDGDLDIVSWRPSGTAFQVNKRDQFMKKILPKYFKQSKFKSFVRQLNLWGYTIIDTGPDKGSYYHSKFVRGQPQLCHEMRRQKKPRAASVSATPPRPPAMLQQQYPPPSGVVRRAASDTSIGLPFGYLGGRHDIPGRISSNIGVAPDLNMGPYNLESIRPPMIGSSSSSFVNRGLQQQQQSPSFAQQYPVSQHFSSSTGQMLQRPLLQLGPSPVRDHSSQTHPYVHTTNESNSNLQLRPSNESPRGFSTDGGNWADNRLTLDRGGDWFDRLEAMFEPTDVQQFSGGPSSGVAAGSLEPRPIRSPGRGEQKQDPSEHKDNSKRGRHFQP